MEEGERVTRMEEGERVTRMEDLGGEEREIERETERQRDRERQREGLMAKYWRPFLECRLSHQTKLNNRSRILLRTCRFIFVWIYVNKPVCALYEEQVLNTHLMQAYYREDLDHVFVQSNPINLMHR